MVAGPPTPAFSRSGGLCLEVEDRCRAVSIPLRFSAPHTAAGDERKPSPVKSYIADACDCARLSSVATFLHRLRREVKPMFRHLIRTFALLPLLGAGQIAQACFWCNWYVCSWESGPGRLHCVQTCYGGTGDPGDNCWCVVSGPACWGAQAPGNPSWLASSSCLDTSLPSATSPAARSLRMPIVLKDNLDWSGPRQAARRTTVSQGDVVAPNASPLPKGCTERLGTHGERIVECVAPGYLGPSRDSAFTFSADPGLLLQLAEFNRSLAYAVYALQRTSQSAHLDRGGGELVVSVPTDAALVRDVILGHRTARNADGRAERFEFIPIVSPTDDTLKFQLRSVDDPNHPAIELELKPSGGVASHLRLIRWVPETRVRKRPTAA